MKAHPTLPAIDGKQFREVPKRSGVAVCSDGTVWQWGCFGRKSRWCWRQSDQFVDELGFRVVQLHGQRFWLRVHDLILKACNGPSPAGWGPCKTAAPPKKFHRKQRQENQANNQPEDYLKYLQSSRWKKHRRGALARAGNACERCGATSDLQVHHTTYDRLGRERPEDLEVLCDGCHENAHEKHGVRDPMVRRYLALNI